MRSYFLAVVFIALAVSPLALAHVNSPDVYYDGNAGPYHLLVTVRPPVVVPGVAQIEILVAEGDVEKIEIRPMRIIGPGARLAPTADAAQRSPGDPHRFTGQLWIMSRGSWKVEVEAAGAKGNGEMAVPLPAVSTNTARMNATLGALLAVLGLALLAGLAGIIGAASREADLATGEQASPTKSKKALRAPRFELPLPEGSGPSGFLLLRFHDIRRNAAHKECGQPPPLRDPFP